jgi:hypothetical protein
MFYKIIKWNKPAVTESLILTNSSTANSNPVIENNLVECLIQTGEIICPEKVGEFTNIILSRTVAELINETENDQRDQLRSSTQNFQAYSIVGMNALRFQRLFAVVTQIFL